MYTKEQKEKIIKKFLNLQNELGSAAKACDVIGINPTVVSGLKNDNYGGSSEKYWKLLDVYFSTKEESEEKNHDNDCYVPTSISEDVYATIKYCQLVGGLTTICGDAGIGKTRAAQKFVEDNKEMSILITVNPCIKSIRGMLKCLCEQLYINEKSIDEMWFGCANKLRDKMVIIIDEAQHLPVTTIESLRALSDYFTNKKQTLGIVFMGNFETVNNFSGNKVANYSQIVNRTKQNKRYYTSQISKNDIIKLFPDISDQRGIDFIHAIAQSKQAIRGAFNIFYNALNNENINYEALVESAKKFGAEI